MASIGGGLVTLVDTVCGVLSLLILVYIFVDLAIAFRAGLPRPFYDVRRGLAKIFEPVFAQIRRVVPIVGELDFSPLVALILLNVIRAVVA